MTGLSRKGVWTLALAIAIAGPAFALATAELPALSQLEKGRWQLRNLATDADGETLCLGDPLALTQIEHGAIACARDVISSNATGGTIHYTCRGHGFGQTTVRVETPRLARIETQGVADSRPFARRIEARRVGGC